MWAEKQIWSVTLEESGPSLGHTTPFLSLLPRHHSATPTSPLPRSRPVTDPHYRKPRANDPEACDLRSGIIFFGGLRHHLRWTKLQRPLETTVRHHLFRWMMQQLWRPRASYSSMQIIEATETPSEIKPNSICSWSLESLTTSLIWMQMYCFYESYGWMVDTRFELQWLWIDYGYLWFELWIELKWITTPLIMHTSNLNWLWTVNTSDLNCKDLS